jgi:hypothetical protein
VSARYHAMLDTLTTDLPGQAVENLESFAHT